MARQTMEVRYGLTPEHRATLDRLERAKTLTPFDRGALAGLALHATGEDLDRVRALSARLGSANA
jgi:hypothetical protein